MNKSELGAMQQSIIFTCTYLSMHVERIMVKTGPEKKMAVESPMGRRSTDSLISQRKSPPRIPWATNLHLVEMSDGPSGEELVNHMRGAITAIWMRHLMKRRCQDEASVQYLGGGIQD